MARATVGGATGGDDVGVGGDVPPSAQESEGDGVPLASVVKLAKTEGSLCGANSRKRRRSSSTSSSRGTSSSSPSKSPRTHEAGDSQPDVASTVATPSESTLTSSHSPTSPTGQSNDSPTDARGASLSLESGETHSTRDFLQHILKEEASAEAPKPKRDCADDGGGSGEAFPNPATQATLGYGCVDRREPNAACHLCDHRASRPGRKTVALQVRCQNYSCTKVFCSVIGCRRKLGMKTLQTYERWRDAVLAGECKFLCPHCTDRFTCPGSQCSRRRERKIRREREKAAAAAAAAANKKFASTSASASVSLRHHGEDGEGDAGERVGDVARAAVEAEAKLMMGKHAAADADSKFMTPSDFLGRHSSFDYARMIMQRHNELLRTPGGGRQQDIRGGSGQEQDTRGESDQELIQGVAISTTAAEDDNESSQKFVPAASSPSINSGNSSHSEQQQQQQQQRLSNLVSLANMRHHPAAALRDAYNQAQALAFKLCAPSMAHQVSIAHQESLARQASLINSSENAGAAGVRAVRGQAAAALDEAASCGAAERELRALVPAASPDRARDHHRQHQVQPIGHSHETLQRALATQANLLAWAYARFGNPGLRGDTPVEPVAAALEPGRLNAMLPQLASSSSSPSKGEPRLSDGGGASSSMSRRQSGVRSYAAAQACEESEHLLQMCKHAYNAPLNFLSLSEGAVNADGEEGGGAKLNAGAAAVAPVTGGGVRSACGANGMTSEDWLSKVHPPTPLARAQSGGERERFIFKAEEPLPNAAPPKNSAAAAAVPATPRERRTRVHDVFPSAQRSASRRSRSRTARMAPPPTQNYAPAAATAATHSMGEEQGVYGFKIPGDTVPGAGGHDLSHPDLLQLLGGASAASASGAAATMSAKRDAPALANPSAHHLLGVPAASSHGGGLAHAHRHHSRSSSSERLNVYRGRVAECGGGDVPMNLHDQMLTENRKSPSMSPQEFGLLPQTDVAWPSLG